ncbi:hypothetical protein AB0M92_09540 [Streptomyces sp. NPDC051582]|uniref:hypothetical protein n=1 Tax=Streptomyces sp. NPDC051582 TaxID=3155167 RepID=UPI003417B842
MIEWRDHEAAPPHALGHPETAREREGVLVRRPSHAPPRAAEEPARAGPGRGPTSFDVLTEIIENRTPGSLCPR